MGTRGWPERWPAFWAASAPSGWGGGWAMAAWKKIHWLHLTPKRLKWPERFFKRHGAKMVFIARFIFLFPPVVANLLAGMSKMPLAHFSVLQRHGVGGLFHHLHPDRIFFREEMEAACSLAGSHGAFNLIFAGLVIVVLA